MLVAEILNEYREDFEVSEIFSMLLSRSSIEKSFIKTEIVNGLQNACNHYPTLENCQAALNHSFSKSVGIVKISLKLLDTMIGKLSKNEQFSILLKLIEGKRQDHIIIAKKILVELELLWPELPIQISSLDSKLSSWITSLRAPKSKHISSLKDTIKLKKENIATDRD